MIIGYNIGAERRHARREPDRDRFHDFRGEPSVGHFHHCGQLHLYTDLNTASLRPRTFGKPGGSASGWWKRGSGAGFAATKESRAVRAALRVLEQRQCRLLLVGSACRRGIYCIVGDGLGGYTEEGASGG